MRNTEKLIKELRLTNGFRNKLLARNIEERYNSNEFCIPRDSKKLEKIENRSYVLLLKLLPQEVSERIIQIDKHMNAMIDFIERRSGWTYTKNGFMYRDNFQNMHDPEFRSFDTYEIRRDKNGFHLDTNDAYKDKYIYEKERLFYILYEDMLDVLNSYINEKERLLLEGIELSSNKELAESLAIYLGYKKEEQDTKEKEKIK